MEVTFTSVQITTSGGGGGSNHPPRKILKNVAGKLTPGRITALMGQSGSGKTSLIRTLSRRFEPSLRYEGTVRYDGGRFTTKNKRQVAFVPQDDVHPRGLTVRQHLEISSILRLGDLPDNERKERLASVIAKLRLEKCVNTVIEGVSGGERKRTCIAAELLTQPRLLFLDEPTSGLDSTLANVMVDAMVELANAGGITVCTTIHQPSSMLFAKMHDLIVLTDGEVFYRGPAAKLVEWFENCGRPCPPNFNPADYLLDLLVLDSENLKKDQRVQDAIRALPSVTHMSPASQSAAAVQNSTQHPKLKSSPSVIFDLMRQVQPQEEDHQKQYALSFLSQVHMLVRRMMIRYSKEIFTRQQIICEFGLALVSALLWFNLPLTSSTVFLRGTVAFWLVGTDMYLSLFSSLFALHEEENLLKKDLFDSAYSLRAYFVARSLCIFPQNCIWSIFYVTVTLAATQAAPSWGNAVIIVLLAQLCIINMQSWGLFFSATVPLPSVLTTGIVTVTYFFAFSGLFAPPSTIQPGLAWLRYIDPQTYLWQLQMYSMFPSTAMFVCDQASSNTPQCTSNETYGYVDGNEALDMFEVDIAPWVSVVVLVVSPIVLRWLAYMALTVRVSKWTGNRKKYVFFGPMREKINDVEDVGVGGGAEAVGGNVEKNGSTSNHVKMVEVLETV